MKTSRSPEHALDYFYTPPDCVRGRSLTIEGDEFVHLTHVMRKQPGDRVMVVDGVGTAYEVRVEAIERRTARCSVVGRTARLHEPAVDVAVGVGLLKHPSSMDFLVEKLTELGVSTIVPLATERTIPDHARVARWEKIALAAMKQSCRCVLPALTGLTPFRDFIAQTRHEWKIIPHEAADAPHLRDRLGDGWTSATVCVGPEGGFSEREVALAVNEGFEPVVLGPRRLRTETAAIVAAAWLLR
jgi:16S rRNA (uracil1498-N3)-methyltransferase